jgi:hypothetical protein
MLRDALAERYLHLASLAVVPRAVKDARQMIWLTLSLRNVLVANILTLVSLANLLYAVQDVKQMVW